MSTTLQKNASTIAELTLEELDDAVRKALVKVAPESAEEELDPAVNFRDQIEFDSMDFVAFVLALEKTLGVKVPESDYPKLSSLEGCRHYFVPA